MAQPRDILKRAWAKRPRDARSRAIGAQEGGTRLEPSEIAKLAVEAASDKKASDVVLLDIRELSIIADYFVICTGSNSRQIQAIASAIEDRLSEVKVPTRGREGAAETGWVLLDCGDVIVHIFGPMERDYYRLERLWSSAPTVVYMQ
jgi:ribosome-associated protein